jgi:hypothetical protein
MERKTRPSSRTDIQAVRVPGRTDIPPAPARAEGEGRTGADGLVDDIKSTRRDLLSARHPAYHRVLGAVLALVSGADDALVARFERVWRTRSFPTFYERPLLILAALRADALEEGAKHPLHAALAAAAPDADAVTPEAVAAALARDRLGVWSAMTTRRMQTNDTTRAVTWLWPAALAGCDDGQRPLAIVDVGASAGLNLVADQLPHLWSEVGSGSRIGCATRVDAVARVGFDTRPLDVKNHDDVRWMRACIWPGETERLARFEAGVAAMRASLGRPGAPVLERMTASLVPDHLQDLVAKLPADALLLAYHTLVTGYLEAAERERYRSGMLAFVQRQPVGSVLWAELELDDARRRLPAVLAVHVRAGDAVRSVRLGRSSQHPGEIEVDAAGVAEVRRHLAARG